MTKHLPNDTAHCQQSDCPASTECLRFMAHVPDDARRVTYFAPEFTDAGCDYKIELRNEQ